MAKLGDQRALLTWMRYTRWPAFAIILGIIGMFVGIMFGAGLFSVFAFAGGAVLGAILGLVMGVDKNLFPVTVDKYIKYAGGLFRYVGSYPAAVWTIDFTDQKGRPVEPRRVVYLQGWTLRQMPPFSLPNWFRLGETQILPVMQLDTYTYRPMTFTEGKIIVEDVPVYERGPDGKPIVEEFQDEETGETKKRYKVVGMKRVEVFNSNEEYDPEVGKMVTIPTGFASKLDNDRAIYANNLRWLYEMTEVGDFWQRYGPLLVAFFCIAGMLLIGIFGYIKFSEVASNFAKDTSDANTAASSSNAMAAQLNAQVASALLKAGFNVNTSFCPNNQPAPATGGVNPINLPIVGKVG